MSHRRAKIVSGGFCAILLRKAQEMFFFFLFLFASGNYSTTKKDYYS